MTLLALACSLPPKGVPTIDDDRDGFPASADCDDTDPARHPGATWTVDRDGDRYTAADPVTECAPPEGYLPPDDALGEDCDDTDAALALVLDWYLDDDGDGYGVGTPTPSCGAPGPGWVSAPDDCDPADPHVHPEAPEDCGTDDLNCNGPDDPACRLAGTFTLPSTNRWTPEAAVRGPELDGDARADVLLLGDFATDAGRLVARRYDLDDAGAPSAPMDYAFDTPFAYYGLSFRTLPDVDADGAPEIWLVAGDYNDTASYIWDLDGVTPGTLFADSAWYAAEGEFGAMGSAIAAADLRSDPGDEVAIGALGYLRGRVEIWGGFSAAPRLRTTIDGPETGAWLGADLAATDLDGDGAADVAATLSASDASSEALYIFRGPFVNDVDYTDADAQLWLPGGLTYALGSVELAGDLTETGRPWLWWGAPDAAYGGRLLAVPGDVSSEGVAEPRALGAIEIASDESGFGGAVAVVGDQTGDGVADPLVGAPLGSGSAAQVAFLLDARAVVRNGEDLVGLNADGIVQARFVGDGATFGYIVAGAGEVDDLAGDDVWIGGGDAAYLFSGGVIR